MGGRQWIQNWRLHYHYRTALIVTRSNLDIDCRAETCAASFMVVADMRQGTNSPDWVLPNERVDRA